MILNWKEKCNGRSNSTKIYMIFRAVLFETESPVYMDALKQLVEERIVKDINELKEKVNLKNALSPLKPSEMTVLHLACFANDLAFAAFLISNGADPHYRNHKNLSPLMIAIKNNNQQLLNVLQPEGATPPLKEYFLCGNQSISFALRAEEMTECSDSRGSDLTFDYLLNELSMAC